MERDWNRFLEAHCSENSKIKDSPLYNGIAERFGVSLTEKLITILNDFAYPESSRMRAADLLRDMTHFDYLDVAYPSLIKRGILLFFQSNAIYYMLRTPNGSRLQLAGRALTTKLVRLSLLHDDPWTGFLRAFEESFRKPPPFVELHAILDLLCDMEDDAVGVDENGHGDDDIRHKFVSFLEPTVRENVQLFHTTMLDRLHAAEQEAAEGGDRSPRVFQILQFFYGVITQENQRSALMEGAIMSPFLDYDPQTYFDYDDDPPVPFTPYQILHAATYVKLCIERGVEFRFSLAMIRRMNVIILRLHRVSWYMPRARRVA